MTRPTGDPLRIAALQPSISIVLESLGCLGSIVACTRYCLQSVPALRERNLKIVSDSWSSTAEEILSAQPDLVIASVPYRLESLASILKSGCPALTLAPHSLEDIYLDIRLLGALLHTCERAESVIAQMRSFFDEVRAKSSQSSTSPVVYCEEWGKPLIHSQRWVSELVSAAGGRFLGVPGSSTDSSAVAAKDPDVLIFAWCGAGDRVPLARVIEKRAWHSLRAVRNHRVYCIPDELLNTPGTNLAAGLDVLASAIHPEIFGKSPRIRTLK